MRDLSRRTFRCECGNVMGRDQNASVNIYGYVPAGGGERLGASQATRVEIGYQGCAPVPVDETRMLEIVA